MPIFVYYFIFHKSLLIMCIIAFHFKLTKKLLGLINYQVGASTRAYMVSINCITNYYLPSV